MSTTIAHASQRHDDDYVTPIQALYLEAFQRWLQSGDPEDRAEAKALLRLVRREVHAEQQAAA